MSASIKWYGHATFALTLPDERVVMIDPWLEGNPACPDSMHNPPRCDVIALTHGHFDHVGAVAKLIEDFNPLVVANFELCAVLEKQLGKGQYSPMSTGGTQDVGGVRISLTQAFHSSSFDSPDGPLYAGMPNGVVVTVEGLATVYHAGDTDVFSDMKLIAKLFDPKVCILPIGDHFTMGAKGAALAAEILDPTAIIPFHYKTFPVLAQSADDYCNALSPELRDRVVIPEVGQNVSWNQSGISL